MKIISEADVVLALGTRLGPFGSLPQYEFDYWPKDAKIIQVDIAPRRLGLTKGKISKYFIFLRFGVVMASGLKILIKIISWL